MMPDNTHEALAALIDKKLDGDCGYGVGAYLATAVLAWLVAEGWSKTEPDQWEYGVEYEVTSTRSVHTAAHSEKQARKWVERSPTDTGLRRRRPARPAGPWEVIPDAE
jgi:hypothetical protein